MYLFFFFRVLCWLVLVNGCNAYYDFCLFPLSLEIVYMVLVGGHEHSMVEKSRRCDADMGIHVHNVLVYSYYN